jgi:glycosyltransferase involved in cell wall biosynthesis
MNYDKSGDLRGSSSVPLISIITICKNAGGTIAKTLASVRDCQYPRLEYVIVDGGSTDDTQTLIQQYSSCVDKYVSEPDNGISDALNKAVDLSSGDYHLVVHADDVQSNQWQGRGRGQRKSCQDVRS